MSEPTAQFGRVPYQIINAGAVARMKGSEAKVYLAIAGHVNSSWTATLSLDRIAALAGVQRSTMCEALRSLAEAGLIEVERGAGGRGRTNTYRLCPNSPAGLTVSPAETVRYGPRKQSAPTHKTVRGDRVNSPPQRTRTERTERTEQQQRGTTAAGGAGGGLEPPADQAVVEALAEVGIGQPKRSELARRWTGIHGAAVKIRATAAKLNGSGKGSGVLVRDLEAQADAETIQAHRRQDRDQVEAQARRLEQVQQAELSALQRDRQAWLADQTDGEVVKVWRRFLRHPSTPARYKVMWAKGDPPSVSCIRDAFGDDLAALFAPKNRPAVPMLK